MNQNEINNQSNTEQFAQNQHQPLAQRREFITDLLEKIFSILIFPIAYIYVSYLFSFDFTFNRSPIYLGVFTVLFIITAEVFYFKRKHYLDSILFLLLTIAVCVPTIFNIGLVWHQSNKIFFLHLFAMYYVLCRSDRLAEGETSHMFLWDGITAFFVMPFKNFPLVFRTIASIFRRKKEGKKVNPFAIILPVILGIILLIIALGLLGSADDNFKVITSSITNVFKFDYSFISKLPMTIILSMYLYGYLGGCYRETKEQVAHRGDNIKQSVARLKKVPGVVWIIFIAIFSVFYILFFGLQGSYLFDAFSMTLPTQYTFAEYARKGFGDMCGVVIVNFILLWLASRTSEINEESGVSKTLKFCCNILNLESLLFVIISMLKLLMYINAYGFTPLRLQSMWLVFVFMIACICIFISLNFHKKTAKIWFLSSATLLAVLCFI